MVKIYEVIFEVAGTTLTIKRKHLSGAPFKVAIHLKHVKPGTKLLLTAHALIAVHHGPKRSKTLRRDPDGLRLIGADPPQATTADTPHTTARPATARSPRLPLCAQQSTPHPPPCRCPAGGSTRR